MGSKYIIIRKLWIQIIKIQIKIVFDFLSLKWFIKIWACSPIYFWVYVHRYNHTPLKCRCMVKVRNWITPTSIPYYIFPTKRTTNKQYEETFNSPPILCVNDRLYTTFFPFLCPTFFLPNKICLWWMVGWHNIIQIHDNVLWDLQHSIKICLDVFHIQNVKIARNVVNLT